MAGHKYFCIFVHKRKYIVFIGGNITPELSLEHIWYILLSMKEIKTYTDPIDPIADVTTPDQWLSDEVYKEVVQKTVVTCSDAVVTCMNTPGCVYLAKRVAQPQKGLWYLGGRVQFNSATIADSIAINVKRETGMVFPSERFVFLTMNDYKFINSAQGNFPARSLSAVFVLELSKEELEQMSQSLLDTEYEPGFGLHPFNREQLVEADVHPAILDSFDLIWNK